MHIKYENEFIFGMFMVQISICDPSAKQKKLKNVEKVTVNYNQTCLYVAMDRQEG